MQEMTERNQSQPPSMAQQFATGMPGMPGMGGPMGGMGGMGPNPMMN
jgi:hypothetical protein